MSCHSGPLPGLLAHAEDDAAGLEAAASALLLPCTPEHPARVDTHTGRRDTPGPHLQQLRPMGCHSEALPRLPAHAEAGAGKLEASADALLQLCALEQPARGAGKMLARTINTA